MNYWRIASRWSNDGNKGSTILDMFMKHSVVFIYNEGHVLDNIKPLADEEGDLIAIMDGQRVAAIAQAVGSASPLPELGVKLTQKDSDRIGNCEEECIGLKVLIHAIDDQDIWHSTQGRFMQIRKEEVIERLRIAWEKTKHPKTEQDFNIEAESISVRGLLNGSQTELFMIPIYQRPYGWEEQHLERFINDILDAFDANKSLFIGNIQLSSPKQLDLRGSQFQDVIDGQQRLTTIALLMKAILRNPDAHEFLEVMREYRWLETKVNRGQQQELLDVALHSNDSSVLNPTLNIYQRNYNHIQRILDKQEKAINYNCLAEFVLDRLRLVKITTCAGLSETLKIFNTINTAGMDLNAGDLFKIRAYEYLTEKCNQSQDCFDTINDIYKDIDDANQRENRHITSIGEILWFYQKILVGSKQVFAPNTNGLPNYLSAWGSERFYEQLFDALLGIKKWDGFVCAYNFTSRQVIDLAGIRRLVGIRLEQDKRWRTLDEYDYELRFAYHVIDWSRYHQYYVLGYIAEYFCNDEVSQEKIKSLIVALSKLFLVYSINYGKQIYPIHTFIQEIISKLAAHQASGIDEIVESIVEKTAEQKEKFERFLETDFASYATAKNLACRVLDIISWEKYASDKVFSNKQRNEKLDEVFTGGYDIEHIQSYNDENFEKRESIQREFGILLNSLGNLMLLDSSVNRSISNNVFKEKLKAYIDTPEGSVAHSIAEDYGHLESWFKKNAENKLKRDKKALIDYIYGSKRAISCK